MAQTDTLPLNSGRQGIIRRVSVRFGGSKPQELERFIKFLCVGGLGAVIDLGLTNLSMRFIFHVGDKDLFLGVVCSAIGFTAATFSNFMLNRYWTYPDSRSTSMRRQMVQFFIVASVGMGIRIVVVSLLSSFMADLIGHVSARHWFNIDFDKDTIWKLGVNLAIMVALVIVALWNFFANRYWTYGDVE